MARRPKSEPVAKAARTEVAVKVALEPNDTGPTFYVNYIEVGQTPNDFVIFGARLPGKISSTRMEQVSKNGSITIEAEVQLIVPVSVIPGLIHALTIQKKYMKNYSGHLSK